MGAIFLTRGCTCARPGQGFATVLAMSHPEQLGFFRAVADANAPLVDGGRVLEVGAYDVNGTIRGIFAGAGDYVGIDLTPGPGVDVVGYGHEYVAPEASFDLAISGECFEHDSHYLDTFANMCRLVRGGGVVAFTCASTGRPEHGTTRSDPTLSPGTAAHGDDYYRNLVAEDFASVPMDSLFSEYAFWTMSTSMDLYFAGVRLPTPGHDSSAPTGALPNGTNVEALKHLMPLPHKLIRLPLRLLASRLDQERYQTVILPYWRSLLTLNDKLAGSRFLRSGGAQLH